MNKDAIIFIFWFFRTNFPLQKHRKKNARCSWWMDKLDDWTIARPFWWFVDLSQQHIRELHAVFLSIPFRKLCSVTGRRGVCVLCCCVMSPHQSIVTESMVSSPERHKENKVKLKTEPEWERHIPYRWQSQVTNATHSSVHSVPVSFSFPQQAQHVWIWPRKFPMGRCPYIIFNLFNWFLLPSIFLSFVRSSEFWEHLVSITSSHSYPKQWRYYLAIVFISSCDFCLSWSRPYRKSPYSIVNMSVCVCRVCSMWFG